LTSRSRKSHSSAVGLFVVALLLGGLLMYVAVDTNAFAGAKSPFATTTTTSGPSPNNGQTTCSQNSVKGVLSSYQSVFSTSTGSPTINRFVSSTNGLVSTIDNPGANNWATAYGPSTQAYTLSYIDEFTASNSYPLWVNVGTQGSNNPVVEFGQSVYQVTCLLPASGSNNALVWSEAAQLFSAPASGLTASTSVKAIVQYPGAAPSAVPTSPQTWNFKLQILAPNVVGMVPTTAYGTVSNPITNYGNGQQITTSGPVTVTGIFVLATNETNILANFPGAISVSPIGGTAARMWVAPITSGCAPSPAATAAGNPYDCIIMPVQLYATSTLSHHASIVGIYADMQQVGYTVGNFVSPVVTSYPSGSAAGTSTFCGAAFSTAGTCAGFSFGTPISGQNTGNPTSLIGQYVAVTLPN